MIKILSAEQTRKADKYTIESEPILSIDLMERASNKWVEIFLKILHRDNLNPKDYKIFCGYGNNGGDGLAIARILQGIVKTNIQVYILADKTSYSEDFTINLIRLKNLEKVEVFELKTANDFPIIENESIVIDGLFGSGLNKPLEGLSLYLVKYINKVVALKFAIDIPSGLLADEYTNGESINATYTITFQSPKYSFLFVDNYVSVGEWHVADIGIDKNFIESQKTSCSILEQVDIKSILIPRKKIAHKGNFGHAFIYAGNEGKMGASILCTKACVCSGAGLTTVLIPKNCSTEMNIQIPEAMTIEYSLKNHSVIDLSKFDCYAFGPGIGTAKSSRKIFFELLKNVKSSIVLDADALNILSDTTNFREFIPTNSILTPHFKEFERLFGKSENWQERHLKQLDASKTFSIYIILKGAYTCITTPTGYTYFNITGNAGMAKGGNGDILTGIIVALLAQNYTEEQACLFGVYLHGLAGDIAINNSSEISLLGSEIIKSIGNAYNRISLTSQ